MRLLGFYWGILGVLALLLYAVFRLSPQIWEMSASSLNGLHWLLLALFVPFMAYAEGYKGFHLAFAPRLIARANYLRTNGRPALLLLAPLFCMGYLHATRRRKAASFALTLMIIALVLLLTVTPQPWRGIIDAGVVTGLCLGIASILRFWMLLEAGSWEHPISLDLPDSSPEP